MNSDNARHGWKKCKGQRGKLGDGQLEANDASRYDLVAYIHKACGILKNETRQVIRDFKAFIEAPDLPIPS